MPLASGQKIIITSADGTKRRRLPSAQIMGAKARIERYGGYGQFSVDTAIPFSGDALSTILKGDRVEMYYGGVLRYRGWIEERMRVEGEPDTVGFVGYGLSFLLGQQLCYGRYAYTGNGADLATVFAEVVRDATQSRNQTLPPAMGRQGLPLYDALQVLQVGALTTFVDAYHKLLGDVANDLVQQSGHLCIWGGDVDAYGQNRAYFRPLASSTGMPLRVIPVPARRTQTAQAEDQAGDVKNRTLMTGGQPRFPQMLHNGGFDLPAAFQTGDSGLIADGDFEQKSWSLSNGAAYKDAGHQEGQPFSGNWMVELDHVGEACDRNGAFATTPVAGHSYVFSVRAKKEVGLQTADGSGTLVLKNAANNLLLSVPLTVTPTGTAWDYFSATFAMPANAARWFAHFQCDHIAAYNGDSGGLLLDAVSLEDASVVYQDGWQVEAFGSAAFAAVHWAYKDVAFDGLYCVYLSPRCADANGQDGWLVPLGRARVPVLFKQTLRLSFRYRSPLSPALGLPKMQLQLDWFRADGSDIRTDTLVINAAAVSGTWQYAELVASAPSDAASVLPRVNPRSNGDVLIGGVSLQDAGAVAAGDVPLMPDGHPGFLPEGDLSTFLTAAASGLGGDYASSEFAYGSRVDITSQGAVNTLPGLTTVAKARLGVKALALIRPGIARMEDATVYWPGDSVGLQGKHGGLLDQGQLLTIAAVDLSFGDLFVANLEIGKEAPDETLAAKSLIQEQLRLNGPGGAAGAGGTGGGYTNSTNFGGAGSGGATTAVTLQTITESATDPTTHDQVRTGPHLSDAERGSWTAKEPGLGLPSANGQVLGSNTAGVRGWVNPPAGLPTPAPDGAVPHYSVGAQGYAADSSLVYQNAQILQSSQGGHDTGFKAHNTGTDQNDNPAFVLQGPTSAITTLFQTTPAHGFGELSGFYTSTANGFTVFDRNVVSRLHISQDGKVAIGASIDALGYNAADGSPGTSGTSGGGDTVKNGLVTALGTPPARQPAAHAGTHAANGSDPVSPTSIGAESLASKGAVNGYAALDAGGKIPTNQLPASIVGALEYQGTWDANANSPALTSGVGTKGFYYKVSIAGNTTLDGNSGWHVGDWAAFDGATWDKIDNFEAVTSVAGRVGAITLSSTDIAGLGTAAVAYLPAAGSNATAAQVVRGDDTRLGAGTGTGGGILSVSALPVASTATAGSLYRLLSSSSAVAVLTSQGTEFDSGTSFGGFEGPKAFDGSASTAYAGGGTNYVGLDFGAGNAKQITQIRYMGRGTLESRMVGGVFQGSNTSATTGFVTLATVTTAPPANPAYSTVAVTDSTQYRWVRYTNPTGSGGYVDVAEIEFTGITVTPDRLYVSLQSAAGTYAWVQLATG